MKDRVPVGFFAYPSQSPTLAESIVEAVKILHKAQGTKISTWEECRVGGKLVIGEVCRAIDGADLFCADLTGQNANVLFELGYAIAKNKRVWVVRDCSYADDATLFGKLRILTTLGYASASNSDEIVAAFSKDDPFGDLDRTVFSDSIEPNLDGPPAGTLLYLKNRHDTQSSIHIARRIDASPIPTIVDDPGESAVQTLQWYGDQVYAARGVVVHLTSPERKGAVLHTARQSFVAGLAYGLNKSLLMLSESDVLAPLDYRDLLRRYDNARNAKTELDVWLDPVEKEFARETDQAKSRAHTIRLASELKGLRFGEYIAENESRDKLDACFVPTAAYNAAIEGTTTLFVGRKGSGKSANLLRLERELAGDSRNLVCVIKPVAYEMQGLVDLLRKYEKRDSKGYAVDALWKYVLYTEIARTLRARLDKRHNSTWTDSEQWFGQYVDQQGDIILDDFSVRLENCVDLLLEGRTGEWEDKVKDTRLGISEALHVNALGGLLKALGPAMERIGRVCILIDNLDKAWERSADISVLAELILGLLGIAQRVPRDLRLGKVGGRAVEASLAVFLRSDIFDNVRRVAREPDKLLSTRLDWSDPEMLVRVLEERFMVGREDSADPRQLWDRYFCESVQGKSTREYLLSTILPRPRDLIFFTNACVSVAVNRGHGRVEPGDIEEAEKQYSQYALESVLVESTGEEIDMEGVTFAFADGEQVVSETDVTDVLSGAGVSAKEHLRVIDRLCGLTFLGPEVGDGIYNYCEDAQAYKLAQVRASSFARRSERGRRWRIHPAFCGFLEVGRESD